MVSGAALLAVGAGILGLWVTSTDSLRKNYSHYLIGLAQTASTLIDPDLHNAIRRPEQRNGPDYNRAVAPLRHMRAVVSDIHYLYTVVPQGATIRFVLDAADPGGHLVDGGDDQSGVWEVYPERDPAMLQALGMDHHPPRAAATDRPYMDKWGTFMTGWAPLFDRAGGLIGAVGVDVNADVYMARLATARRWALLGLAPAGLLIIVLGATFYRIRLRGLNDAQAALEAAWRDRLTGLANRALFMRRLQQAVVRVQAGTQPLFAVLFLDFDRFKLINDTLGHEAGDQLLRQIAQRLQCALRAADTRFDAEAGNLVGRFGGDEFLILINNLSAATDAPGIAERLLNVLAPAYNVLGAEVHSTASIGIVVSDARTASAEHVLRNADVAMYEAKRAGRACSVVFNEAMHTRLARHASIETSLRRAIGTDEITLVYQPIIDLDSGALVSAEALVRWAHPGLGLISPGEFIPIAEDAGLIVPLGAWVLQEACLAMAEWRRQAPRRAPASVSVNLSRAELALGDTLLERVRRCLETAGLPGACLQLEVTEREVMRNPEAALAMFHELHRLGVKLAMDDFGTGTSSLAFLRDFPFDSVKIDRGFLKDLISSTAVLAVVHATITLVENLGMTTVAEGVEESSQVAVLQSLGCRYAQGYLFSPPVPAGQLLDHATVVGEGSRSPPWLTHCSTGLEQG